MEKVCVKRPPIILFFRNKILTVIIIKSNHVCRPNNSNFHPFQFNAFPRLAHIRLYKIKIIVNIQRGIIFNATIWVSVNRSVFRDVHRYISQWCVSWLLFFSSFRHVIMSSRRLDTPLLAFISVSTGKA